MIYSSALNECICDNTDGTTGYFMVDGVCLKHCSSEHLLIFIKIKYKDF